MVVCNNGVVTLTQGNMPFFELIINNRHLKLLVNVRM